MVILNDLRDSGYKQGKDFDFSFYKQEWSGSMVIPRHTIFTFHNGRLASWFALKYS